ncbi:hypothetical protein Pfo_017265 [Paulownia fortunei]|nr:hypothetical protein Pfo_017265 [Paulownia fortunei]
MECRKFEITLISANNLEDVRKICKMKVHARVSIGGGAEKEKRTPTDKHGEINPAWNFTMRYTISESMVQNYNTMLVVKLYCKRKLGDRYIGEVHTSMKELFDCAKASGGRGLRFSYRFGEKVMIDKLLLAESVASWSLS